MTKHSEPFWQSPMRVMDLALEDSHGSWVNSWTPEQMVETALRMNANVLNLMVVNEWGHAYWPSPHIPMQPELNGEDRLGAVVEQARKAGLYVSAMWGPSAAPVQYERHRDWASRTRDGKKLGWGIREPEKCFMLCMNSPYEDLVNEVADQLFRDYDIKLLALDFYHQEPCWCEYCRERCLKDTGVDIHADQPPLGRDNTHRQWQDGRVREQILRISQTIHKHGAALVHYRVIPGTDIIFSEPHTGDMLGLRDKGYMIQRQKADGRATDKADVICTPYGQQYYIGWSKPPTHMRQEFRTIGMHGSNPWPVMWDWEILRDPRGLKPLGQVYAEMKSIEHLMAGARPFPYIALVMSHNIPTCETRHTIEDHGDALKGFHDALTRAHIPFEIIRDDRLTADTLADYSTLILADVTCLSDDQIATIRRFVQEGGHLIATFESSHYTAEGWSRYELGLSDVLGVRFLDEFQTPWCYIMPSQEHPILAHLEPGLGVPHGDIWALRRELAEDKNDVSIFDNIKAGKATNTGRHLKVETTPTAQVIASVYDTRKTRGSYFIKDIVPAIPGRDTGYPAIVVNPFGQGCSVYFAGQPDRMFQRQGHPDYEEMLVRAIQWVSDKPPVIVEAPNTVEATYWLASDGSCLIHLLNHTHDPVFPAPATCEKVPASREVFRAIREVIPVHDVTIRCKNRPATAEVLIGHPDMATNTDGVVLARLEEYAVIRITL